MKAGRCSRSSMETAGAARDTSTGPLSLVERFQALVAVAESITSCRDPEELFRGLARHLQRVVRFDRLGLVLLQPERGVTSARVLETTGTGFTTLPEYPLRKPLGSGDRDAASAHRPRHGGRDAVAPRH